MSIDQNTERRHIRFFGRVQGVGFRYTTARLAAHLPVSGFVRNLPDGSVELVAEGRPRDLDHLQEAISLEMSRHIESAQVMPGPATGEFAEFEIRR
jgi:acylphosphatase